jgi:YebC/PmpR family DNA-binding regulatory protein
MSGHSKWHSIKHKKGAADAKRGKVFTAHAKLIALAAQQGGDPDMNPALRSAIDRAKMDNLPNANIERSIKKGTGELKDGSVILELTYEGYAPGGTAIYVQVVTDNKNRAVSNVRSIFTKHGGNLGENGCVAWMFKKKGMIVLDIAGMEMEEVEMAVIESGADDMEADGTTMTVYTDYKDLMNVKKALEAEEMKVESADISFIAQDTVKVEDPATAKKILRLMEALEDDEDVTNVSSNFDISEEVMEALI